MKHRRSIPHSVFNAQRLQSFLFCSIALLVSCICQNQENEIQEASRDLSNQATSFIYNAIPEQTGATITPEYSTAINTFSVRLLTEIYRDARFTDGNVVISPFSLGRNLALLTEGATGTARNELLELLGGQTALNDAKDALAELLYEDPSVILECADAIWINSAHYTVQPEFLDKAHSRFGVECTGLDFGNAQSAADNVNDWIRTNTHNHISNIISKDFITSSNALLLTNAVYFEADWQSPFDITLTQDEDFSTPNGSLPVPMMTSAYLHLTSKRGAYENVRLFYGTKDTRYFYLDIYMPVNSSVGDFLADSCLAAASRIRNDEYGKLRMPKFSFKSDIDMIPMLKRLGVAEIFNQGTTDLSTIATNSSSKANADLYVEAIRHVAGIETDEEGTKAYAVSVSGMTENSGGLPSSPDVVVNRPFIYFIRAGENGLILFAGVVNNPNEK